MPTFAFCRVCGVLSPKFQCAKCRETAFCCKEHQISNWRAGHRDFCRFVSDNPLSIWVEVHHGEGNGLLNPMTQHIFANKADGLAYVQSQPEFSNDQTSRPLRSPFCELLGWDVEMFCSTLFNRIHPPYEGLVDAMGNGELKEINGAAIYLGCDVQSGITRHMDVEGRIFVTGRNQSGRSLTADILWGILNFIWDSMSLYGKPDGSADTETLSKWLSEYKKGTWQPRGGTEANIDVYCVVPEDCRSAESVIDHTLLRPDPTHATS